MTDTYLKSWVDRAENLDAEHKAIGGDKRDLFSEAKNKGYNPKVLRRLLRERARDTAEQAAEDAELETYRAALGMAVELVGSGVSLRKAAKAAGVSKSSIHRALAVPAVSHDQITGEVAEVDSIGVAPDERETPSTPAAQAVNAGPPSGRKAGYLCSQGEQSGTHSVEQGDRQSPDDDLVIPTFLKRSAA